MEHDKEADNLKAYLAKEGVESRDRFLKDEEEHILHLAGKILKKNLSKSDEEWSIALLATDEALQSYEKARGDFWPFASFIIKNRLTDHYRKESLKYKREISVDNRNFSGDDIGGEDPDLILQKELVRKTAVTVNLDLADEIESLNKELSDFGISFFDLAEVSPKSVKTRAGCKNAYEAIVKPPPLTGEIKETKNLPIVKILKREKLSRKLLERHRKYIIATVLIGTGDYPKISEYIPFISKR